MSLFSFEEICQDCIHAVFHTCCNSFCYCKMNSEDDADHLQGKCEHRIREAKP